MSSDAGDLDAVGPAPGRRAGAAPRGLTARALGGMFWTFSGTGVQATVQLLAIMALGRLLTPTDFGLMSAAGVVVAFSQIVSQIGVGPAIIQRKTLEPTHVRVAVTLSVLLGTVLGAVVFVGAAEIAALYHIPELEPILRAVAFLFPLDGLNTVAKSLLTRQLRFRLYIVLDVGSFILGYACVGVVLAWLGFGVWALVIANLGQQVIRTVSMYVATRHSLRPSLDFHAGRGLLSFGAGHSMAQIGTLLSQQGDNMVVGRWLGPAALGIYGRAYNLLVMPATVFGRIVNRVLFPVMAQVQNERHRLANAYERAVAVVALVSLPTSAFLWVVAPEFIPIVLGPAWGEVVTPFRLFSISLLFRMGSKISNACVKAAGKVYALALFQFVYAGLVVAGAIAGQHWGVGGVAVCVSVAMAFDWLNTAYLGRSVTGLSWTRFAAAHASGLLLAVIVGAGAVVGAEGGRWAHLGSLLVFIIAGLTATAAAGAAAWLGPGVFLGPHGTWIRQQALGLIGRGPHRGDPAGPVQVSELAGIGEGSPK
jgi:O-antigen/teichoic acid export membrane protein